MKAKAKLKRVSREREFLALADLQHTIWRENYAVVIAGEQIEYMLEHFQSVPAIKEADARGCEYYLIRAFGVNMGYAAVEPNNPQGKMFLSKIYLLEEYRGKGYARDVVNEVREMARSLRLRAIWLTVAKNNVSSIAAYEHLGFRNTEDICKEIGGGFVMDDHVMELSV